MAGAIEPLFSVIIPVYNRAHAVGDAIRSVLAQTCQDFEIVVVDDGSSDDPAAAISSIGDPRIHFIRQPNRGGGAARNTGIDNARGRFIAPLDSDDVFLPAHLETMKALLAATANTVGYARMIVDRGHGRTMLKPPRAIGADEHMATYLLCDRGFIPTITVVVPTAMARQVRYHEHLRYAEDTDFAIRLYLAGCKFVMAEEPGAVWKDIPDPNRSSAGRKGARLMGWLEELKDQIPERAYYGARGWVIAKGVASTDKWAALKMYLTALRHGCYSVRLSAIIFLQIFLPDRAYRLLADRAVGAIGSGKKNAIAQAPLSP
jgi:glycosyltransferase involved in cell wall biosynthesis